MSTTFAELGIPFPLFEAPTEDASDYLGLATCSLCLCKGHCFELAAIMLDCPSCGTTNGLRTSDRAASPCRVCQTMIPFPPIEHVVIKACYSCLRAGKAALTKSTELGLISFDQAFEGVAGGVPGRVHPDFEMVPKGDDWAGARLPQDVMFELLRTPGFIAIHEECWLFCCRQPMVYIGSWSIEEFEERAPDGDAERYFEEIVQDVMPGVWDAIRRGAGCTYAFRCPSCNRLTAYWQLG